MGKYKTSHYIIGFVLSLALTFAAYLLVINQYFSEQVTIASIMVLAIVQLLVQLIFFLHLGSESKPRLKLAIFSFTLLVVLIVVGGSIWVMSHLNYHHDQMSPAEKDNYIFEEEGIYR